MVLAGLLSGDSGILATELVRGQQLAASANAYYDGDARGDQLLTIAATPASANSVSSLKQAWFSLIEQLKQQGPSEQALARVKAQVIASRVYQRDSLAAQASEFGALEVAGLGYDFASDLEARINAVTAEDVIHVAKRYLLKELATQAELIPLDYSSKKLSVFGESAAPMAQVKQHIEPLGSDEHQSC